MRTSSFLLFLSLLALAVIIVACGNRVQASCGGVRHIECGSGYTCKLYGSDPDALGECVLRQVPPDPGSSAYACTVDSDCVVKPGCCDCGVGVWVNKAYAATLQNCSGPTCKCATVPRRGVCENGMCIGKYANAT